MATETTQVINQVSNVQSGDVKNIDPSVREQLENLAATLNKNNDAIKVQTATGLKSFFGLAQSCC